MTISSKISVLSLKNAVSINDLNYILLKRKNEDEDEIPTLHSRDSFTIFAMLDKFLGGNGLLSKKSQCWEEESAISPRTDDQKFEEMLISVSPIPENRREKWTIIVFCETFFSDSPFNDTELEKVMRFCKLLTVKYPKLIISANFLHKY
jgi:hypothetical protein